MTLAIIILSYILWTGDLIESFKSKPSNLAFSSALVTLVSWQCSSPWGIVMCVITTLTSLGILLYNNIHYK